MFFGNFLYVFCQGQSVEKANVNNNKFQKNYCSIHHMSNFDSVKKYRQKRPN